MTKRQLGRARREKTVSREKSQGMGTFFVFSRAKLAFLRLGLRNWLLLLYELR